VQGDPAVLVVVRRGAIPRDHPVDERLQPDRVLEGAPVDLLAEQLRERAQRRACRRIGAAVGVESGAQLPSVEPEGGIVLLAAQEEHARGRHEHRRREVTRLGEDLCQLGVARRRCVPEQPRQGGLDGGHVDRRGLVARLHLDVLSGGADCDEEEQ
jgi:hypothetical protein